MADDRSSRRTGESTNGPVHGEGRKRGADTGSLVWGLILLAVGGWFFVEVTLGYDLPAIDWEVVWPVVIMAIGAGILLRAARRRRT